MKEASLRLLLIQNNMLNVMHSHFFCRGRLLEIHKILKDKQA